MLLAMVNGGILSISQDENYTSGCETCDYGSNYVRWFDLELTTINIHIEAEQMYEYPLSEGQMMKTMLPNINDIQSMEELEFADWLKVELERESGLKLDYNVTEK